MAYTSTVTKQKVTKQQDGFMISVSVVINDGEKDVISKQFSKRHYSGDPIEEVEPYLEKKINDEIDKYKSEQAVLVQSQFDGICASLQTKTNNYIN